MIAGRFFLSFFLFFYYFVLYFFPLFLPLLLHCALIGKLLGGVFVGEFLQEIKHNLWLYIIKWDLFQWSNDIRMEDILSIPYSFPFSLATNSSSSSSKVVDNGCWEDILFCTHSIIYLFDFTSHIPSHPIIMKSILSFFTFKMSGSAVIIWHSTPTSLLFLYYKSPNALDKFKFPLTLPYVTIPPAFSIRSISFGSSGLWSKLSAFVSPLIDATALESPELAQ